MVSTHVENFPWDYAAGVVKEFGPKDSRTAEVCAWIACSSHDRQFIQREAAEASQHFLWRFHRHSALPRGCNPVQRPEGEKWRNALQEECVNSFWDEMLTNTRAKWFKFSEIESDTNRFLQRNMIGQGASGIVFQGTLSDGTMIAVKPILDLQ